MKMDLISSAVKPNDENRRTFDHGRPQFLDRRFVLHEFLGLLGESLDVFVVDLLTDLLLVVIRDNNELFTKPPSINNSNAQ